MAPAATIAARACLCGLRLGVEGVVGITGRVAAVEGVAVVRRQLALALYAGRQVRVGDKVAAESDDVGIACGHDGLGRSRREAARRHDGALVVLTNELRGHRILILAG